jgi:shikimate kinase
VEGGVRVIATGGGAFNDARTRAILNERTITIWLDSPVDVLAERTARRDNRPLLKNGNRASILARLDEERRPFYAEAQIRVESVAGAHRDVVESIVEALQERYGE